MAGSNRSAVVDEYIQKLDHPLKPEIQAVREIILDADPRITEQIKWNAPSFSFEGEDRVTFRLFPATDRIQLVFHRGAKVKERPEVTFQDDSGLLKWITGDRGVITFSGMDEVRANAPALKALISRWMTFARS